MDILGPMSTIPIAVLLFCFMGAVVSGFVGLWMMWFFFSAILQGIFERIRDGKTSIDNKA
jgi:hypothetical protein